MKFEIETELVVAASAVAVWEVVAHRFDEIGLWATAIPASRPNETAVVPDGAEVGGRVCLTAVPGIPDVHETFTYYDEAGMRFGYEASAGLPFFLETAENNWQVQSLGPNESLVKTWAVVETKRFSGLLFAPIFKWQINRAAGKTMEELKYYIEEGVPHPRKVQAKGSKEVVGGTAV